MTFSLKIAALLMSVGIHATGQPLVVRVCDSDSDEAIADAVVFVTDSVGQGFTAITAPNGLASFEVRDSGSVNVGVQHLNYLTYNSTIRLLHGDTLHIQLSPNVRALREVVVTASESKSGSTSSIIDRQAMQHIQPSSFTDLLALLPGGSSATPQTNAANLVQLREAGTSSDDYATSSLGTSFVIDGSPISTDANMQHIDQASSDNQDYYRNTTNKGVDMRSLSTDNIERVEVVRGIPSVEYGDLTSGLVKIERKAKATPWEGRFKADGYGQLFYVGKGFETDSGKTVVNFGIDLFNSQADPRNTLENYKRTTASIRINHKNIANAHSIRWRINADYAGSFDNDKEDPNLNYMREDSYRSSYNRIALGGSVSLTRFGNVTLRSIEAHANTSLQMDRIEQTRFISLDRDRAVPSSLGEGEHDGEFLPYTYTAHYLVDGKPFNLFAKAKANLTFNTAEAMHRVAIGTEWKMDKNYGDGQVYDVTRPLFVGVSTRPRPYKNIPALNQLAVYAEDNINLPVGNHTFTANVGIRASMLPGIDKAYSLHGKIYADPRINVQWTLPSMAIGQKMLKLSISAGAGWHTKMPTLAQLYPADIYKDIIQLNYYHTNPALRRINLMTYIINPTNYALLAARNGKWEVRTSAQWAGAELSVTYFQENMTSGFRQSTVCQPFSYKKYDASGVDYANITEPPSTETLPYTNTSVLRSFGQTTNGSRIFKEGIEFQLSTPRIKEISTRLTVNGAWLRTTYANSQPMFYSSVSTIIENTSVNDLYIGYYDWTDGSVRQRFNTNFIMDTHLESMGLTFSITAQCNWSSSSQTLRRNGIPTHYMDTSGQIYPYTAESQEDKYLQWLVVNYNESVYRKQREPVAVYLNFKATQNMTRYATIAFFVDRLVDYLPDYKAPNGMTIRRSSTPYFGMELNIKI